MDKERQWWIAGGLTAGTLITIACVVVSGFSTLQAEAIYGFGILVIGVVFQTVTLNLNALKAAIKVEEVSVKAEHAVTTMTQIQEQAVFTDERLVQIAKTSDKIHDLVNQKSKGA